MWIRRPEAWAAGLFVALSIGGCDRATTPARPAQSPGAPEQGGAAAAPAVALPAPAALSERLTALASAFDGEVGIAVRDLRAGWTFAFEGDEVFPQQSVAKIWVAAAVLDALDRGKLTLADKVVVRREDLSVFHQPIRQHVDDDGWETTVGELLQIAVSESDNAANDLLIRKVGGSAAVQEFLREKGVTAVRAGMPERELQPRVAGLPWRPEYSFGLAFWDARAAMPDADRQAAIDRYLVDPPDGATPLATVDALARLHRGELLSPTSTAYLTAAMAASKTGPNRLRGGLEPGWTIAHKTGTGQVFRDLALGTNDVGLLTAPDGRAYAVAVFIESTRRPVPERLQLMSDVSRAVVAQWKAEPAPLPPELRAMNGGS